MPINYSDYPPNWKTEIVPHIRARAGDRCEWCGVKNHSIIRRNGNDTYTEIIAAEEAIEYLRSNGGTLYLKAAGFTYIICTTAHVGENKHNKMACAENDLAYLCQKCHLGYDLPDHIRHRRENREKKLGILSLHFENPPTM